jgi:uncharacterized protein YcbX
MPTVVRFSLTPVKSTAMHHPDQVRLERYGAVGDRDFYFVRPDGRFVAGATFGPLVRIRADHDRDAERLTLTFPDGTTAEGDACALGAPVRTSMWGRPLRGHVVDGPFEPALTSYVGTALRLVRCDEPGGAIDVWPATMVSRASVQEFALRAGDQRGRDGRRFRMLVELDGCEAREEEGWRGRRMWLGDAVVRVMTPVPRCVVTTQDPATGIRDVDTLSVLDAYRGRPDGKHVEFGMYAEVLEPGTIRVGDRAEVLDELPRVTTPAGG